MVGSGSRGHGRLGHIVAGVLDLAKFQGAGGGERGCPVTPTIAQITPVVLYNSVLVLVSNLLHPTEGGVPRPSDNSRLAKHLLLSPVNK